VTNKIKPCVLHPARCHQFYLSIIQRSNKVKYAHFYSTYIEPRITSFRGVGNFYPESTKMILRVNIQCQTMSSKSNHF